MRHAARLVIGVLVVLAGGCVSAPSTPEMAAPAVNVKGTWAGTWNFENPDQGTGSILLDLDQAGAEVAGNATVTTRADTKRTFLRGLVTGNTVVLSPPYAEGTLTVSGDEMIGVVEGIMPAAVKLRRQK